MTETPPPPVRGNNISHLPQFEEPCLLTPWTGLKEALLPWNYDRLAKCTLAVNLVPVDSVSTYHDGNPLQNKCVGLHSALRADPFPPP